MNSRNYESRFSNLPAFAFVMLIMILFFYDTI